MNNQQIFRVPLQCHNLWKPVATSGKRILKKVPEKVLWRLRGIFSRSPFEGMTTTKTQNSRVNDWLTPTEVCERLSISFDTWAKWRQRGVAPRTTRLPNGQLRTRTDWLEDFVATISFNLSQFFSALLDPN